MWWSFFVNLRVSSRHLGVITRYLSITQRWFYFLLRDAIDQTLFVNSRWFIWVNTINLITLLSCLSLFSPVMFVSPLHIMHVHPLMSSIIYCYYAFTFANTVLLQLSCLQLLQSFLSWDRDSGVRFTTLCNFGSASIVVVSEYVYPICLVTKAL